MRTICTGILLWVCVSTFAQQNPPVLKITELLQRIDNTSDTVYVVNFWATWCKPCVEELPDFEKANQDFATQKVKVLLVTMDFKEDLEKILGSRARPSLSHSVN